MNEKIYEIMEKVRQTATQAGDVAADVAYGVGMKASELLSVAKMNIRIVSLKNDVNARFRELGELLYATHTGTPTESDVLLEKLQEIDALKAEIQELSAQVGREEAAAACPTCGAAVQEGDQFCRECGGGL